MKSKNLQIIGLILVSACIVLMLVRKPIMSSSENIGYFNAVLRIVGFVGLVLLVPWNKIKQIILDPREYSSNKDNLALVKKLRLRALLLKNISVILLVSSLVFITASLFIIYNPTEKVFDEMKTSEVEAISSLESMLWNVVSVRVTIVFLIIFLTQVLFKVFRYVLRLAAHYDGLADSMELYLLNDNIDLAKVIELFTPEEYDIRELKDSSVSGSLLNLIKHR